VIEIRENFFTARPRLAVFLVVPASLLLALVAPSARATYITVYGGPTWSPGPGGTAISGIDVTGVNNSGTVIGSAYKYDSSGASLGRRAVRFDGSGSPAVELGNLSPDYAGLPQSQATAINSAGTVVGKSRLYLLANANIGDRAARWNSSGTDASMLGQLGPATNISFFSEALAINDADTAVGSAYKVLRLGTSFSDYLGTRAVRWNAASTAVTELGNLGTDSSGVTNGSAYAINTPGTAVGYGQKFTSNTDRGYRAIRWNASGTAATELGNLGTDPSGYTFSSAQAVNDAGTAVGYAQKYDASGAYLGTRPVRWNAEGTAATELGTLGTDLSGYTAGSALDINSAGTIVGTASIFDPAGAAAGERAVRWDASGTAATVLGNLPGFNYTTTQDINDTGIAVGSVESYHAGNVLAEAAVYWGLDALAVDLNALIDPASGWTLNHATHISNTGWIGGRGMFDPDGTGGQEPYERLFLMQIPAEVVPEPSTVVLFCSGLFLVAVAPRRHIRRNVTYAQC
jgi:hypothetical protein